MPKYAICVSESYMLNAFKANDAICHMCKDKVAAFVNFGYYILSVMAVIKYLESSAALEAYDANCY
jgi:hypothetical protein